MRTLPQLTAIVLAIAAAGTAHAGVRAGVDGIPADTRWTTGSGVVLRAAPSPAAVVAGRLGINRRVQLLAPASGDWCAVRTADATDGFVACRLLAEEPVDLVLIANPYADDGSANPHYDPARLFWIEPSWARLQAYATWLDARTPAADPSMPPLRPRDAELERMKAELAKGRQAPAPAERADWATLRRAAATLVQDAPADPQAAAQAVEQAGSTLQLWAPQFYAYEAGGHARIAGAILAVDAPAVRPSLFADARALAPAGDPESLGGHFGIVHRTLTTARATAGDDAWIGLYDMRDRVQSLVRPLQHVRVFRDGRVDSVASHARQRRGLYAGDDHGGCEDYVAGFAHGDADARVWNWYGDDATVASLRRENGNPAGSLYEFYMASAAPKLLATVSRREQALDRERTGFVHATTLVYDLDHDAVPDLLVWEGTGIGPGHMDPTTTDDAWYRLVLANVGGRWQVLGVDTFGYGCGC